MTGAEALLFPGDCLTQAAVRELSKQVYATHPAVASRIEDLLLQQKKGADVQAQIDAQLTLALLPLETQEVFVTRRIALREEQLLHAEQVQDIGHIVRDIMMLKQRNDVLFKLYQYTMPFIKHNRLNFPPMQCTSKTVLMHMLQVIALTCLGLYSPQHKTPTLHIRRQLFAFFTHLATRGSARDIYVFCQAHTYLLRLALMEHFVYFTSRHMALEMPQLLACTGTFYDHARTQRLVQYITDHFRTSALQNETVDWALVERKAQLSVERCNRTCKSQQLPARAREACVAHFMPVGAFRRAVDAPRVDARSLQAVMAQSDVLTAAARWGLSRAVRKYPLPVLLQHKQFAHVQQTSQAANKRTIVVRSLVYVCLRCNQRHPHAKDDMRIQFPDRPLCRHCSSSAYVCVADTLGHLVRVYDNYYYYCTTCSRVHIWRGTGSETAQCPWGAEPADAPRRTCAVCVRTMMLSNVQVFDQRLGVFQNLSLCSKHCPPAPLMHSVHDLRALRRLIAHLGAA